MSSVELMRLLKMIIVIGCRILVLGCLVFSSSGVRVKVVIRVVISMGFKCFSELCMIMVVLKCLFFMCIRLR